jgi:hypothetical protein
MRWAIWPLLKRGRSRKAGQNAETAPPNRLPASFPQWLSTEGFIGMADKIGRTA